MGLARMVLFAPVSPSARRSAMLIVEETKHEYRRDKFKARIYNLFLGPAYNQTWDMGESQSVLIEATFSSKRHSNPEVSHTGCYLLRCTY